MAEFASRGVGNAGLTTGIIGSAGWLLNGGLANLLGGGGNCAENMPVSRYELGQEKTIAEQGAKISLLEANTYNDSKMLEMYKYVDGRLRGIEGQIAQQAVVNAQVTANISCMQNEIATLNGMTKTVIPISNVCPEPMARYNSWTAPAAAASEP
nr:MAG TPA: Polymerase cofactor VP35-coil, VIRAL PROTEIN [Caudoviricetes sp.]